MNSKKAIRSKLGTWKLDLAHKFNNIARTFINRSDGQFIPQNKIFKPKEEHFCSKFFEGRFTSLVVAAVQTKRKIDEMPNGRDENGPRYAHSTTLKQPVSWNCGLQVPNRENAKLSEIIFSVFFPTSISSWETAWRIGPVLRMEWRQENRFQELLYSVSSSSLPASQPLLYIRRRLGNCMKSWQHWVLLSAICCLEFGLRPATTLLSCHYLHHYSVNYLVTAVLIIPTTDYVQQLPPPALRTLG